MINFLHELLKLTAGEMSDEIHWTETNGIIRFWVNTNDLFAWATADAEEITSENIDVLRQSIKDCNDDYYALRLFACRVRKIRPQGACYKYIDKKLWGLFDECGEPRIINVCNPHSKPEK